MKVSFTQWFCVMNIPGHWLLRIGKKEVKFIYEEIFFWKIWKKKWKSAGTDFWGLVNRRSSLSTRKWTARTTKATPKMTPVVPSWQLLLKRLYITKLYTISKYITHPQTSVFIGFLCGGKPLGTAFRILLYIIYICILSGAILPHGV